MSKEKPKLTQEQQKLVDSIKEKVLNKVKPNEKFCLLCPPECEKNNEGDSVEHWYCPMINGQICEVDCMYDMDNHNWPRGKWKNICKDLKCPKYEEKVLNKK